MFGAILDGNKLKALNLEFLSSSPSFHKKTSQQMGFFLKKEVKWKKSWSIDFTSDDGDSTFRCKQSIEYWQTSRRPGLLSTESQCFELL